MQAFKPSLPLESRAAFWRSLHALNITRIVIASLLFVTWGLSSSGDFLSHHVFSYRNICVLYLLLAIAFAVFSVYERRRFQLQLLSQVVVDIAVVSLLYLTAEGLRSGIAILYLFPLASAAILLRLLLALFFASLVTLFLLFESLFRIVQGQSDAPITQAGLYGAAFFAAVFVVNRLAAKLISQETLAMQRGHDLQIQQAINQLVIADMDDGVLVVGKDSTIFACNPSAEATLGLSMSDYALRPKLVDIPYLHSLADAFFAWHTLRLDPTQSHVDPVAFLLIKASVDTGLHDTRSLEGIAALGLHLKVRFATAASEELPEDRSVIFLQDVASIENQAQQLKLASMGRLTASIAHEVRNPLAAIAHASALLSEEASSIAQQRLFRIVADNVARMNRMVDDILNLSRKAHSQDILLLSDSIADIKVFFDEMNSLSADTILVGELDRYHVRFDPMHLREVLLNLLSNAIRYASGRPGCLKIFAVQSTASRLELHVQDDGPRITPEVRAHLFEPFYTTSSKGTGLGLYLARELCANNGAMLDYEFHTDLTEEEPIHSGRFVITFAAPDMTQGRVIQ